MYTPPKYSTKLSQTKNNSIISSTFTTITNLSHTIITTDVNAHSLLWYLLTADHRGELIKDIVLNSNYITLNTKTPTCLSLFESNNLLTRHHHCFSRLAGLHQLAGHQLPHIQSLIFTYHLHTS